MGEVMASWDWAATAVGRPERWPAPLRQVVRILLTSRFSMWMAWGPELTTFYNDAYQHDTLRAKHPWALGRPAREVWAEIWDDIGPRIQSVLDTGEATWDESLLLFLERSGYVEETYHTFSYSPLQDEHGRNAGMLCVVTEDTERVLGERRLRILSELGDISAVTAPTIDEACAAALRVLERGRRDVPFASIYLLDDDGRTARLAGYYGLADDPRIVPALLDREIAPHAPLWPLLQTGEPRVRSELRRDYAGLFVPLDAPMPDADPESVVAVPLVAGGGQAVGVLFAGVSPFRALDEEYERFIDLVGGGVSTAIADARGLQDQLHRAEELAQLDRAKTEFFTGVSHELRTPLTLIAGPAEDSLTDTGDPLSPGQRGRVEVIARNAGRLRRLVDTLLEFSRLEAGKLVPDPAPVDLAVLTRGIAESFAPAVRRAGLEFRSDCPPPPSAVLVDVDMWEKIVLNLLSNAVKYTLAGAVHLGLRATADGVELTVSDTGIGIPPADQPLLFQRFHRVRGAAGRSIEGSGIGLALVAELVALHQGEVGVESAPGRGTTFTVCLPMTALTGAAPVPASVSATVELYREEALQWSAPVTDTGPVTGVPAPGPTGAGPGSTAGATVLVIEDNADLRGFLAGLLSRHYTVAEAEDGRVGLDRIRADRPELVLTDVMMPGLDGFALLSALRADPATATIPVIMLSARAGEEAAIEGLAAGADDYLTKPFSSHDLLARVRSNLELARLRRREGAWRTALINALEDALMVVDPGGRVVEINDAFREVLGYGTEGLPYAPPYPWWPDRAEDPEGFAQAGQAVETAQRSAGGRFLLPQRHRDGRRLWMEISASAVHDPDGDGTMMVNVIRDVTEQHRAALRDRLLADTGELLTRPAELDDRLARFAELAAPVLADLAVIALVAPDGRLRTTAAAHRTTPDVATVLLALPPVVIPRALKAGFRAGRAFVVETVTDDLIVDGFPDEAARTVGRALQMRSGLVVPLVVDGRLLGALSFLSTVSRTHDAKDLALAEELGRRVAGMVQADRVATRERQLRAVTTALGAAATVAEVTRALLDSLGTIFGTQRATVHVVRPDDPTHLHLAHRVGSPPAVADAAVLPVTGPEPSAAAVATRDPLWLSNGHAVTGEAADGTGGDGGRAVAALPLLIEDRVVGVVTLTFPTDRAFPEDERAFIATVVNQAAQALDRAVNADARRQIAETLQRGLLPAELPAVARLALAARYLPAGVHAAAGGDWYDVTVLDDDHVGISVGDVVGHGAKAAAVMGQLRSALAGYLLESHAPAHAVQWLSRFARGVAGARASTAICLVLNTTTGELRWACAGHPPPLVMQPAGGAHYLDDAGGTVLGLMQDSPITEGHAQLTPGWTVVLYPDGRVDRRGEVLDDGLARLAAACGEDRAPDGLIPVLLREALGGDQPGDDVAVIAARLL